MESTKYSHLTPTERIARLEADLDETKASFKAVGRFGVMILVQTLQQLVAERALTAETEREIWRRIKDQMSMIRALNDRLASGAEAEMPVPERRFKSSPPKTHREKLQLRMRKPDTDR
jgi:hypothetical protein